MARVARNGQGGNNNRDEDDTLEWYVLIYACGKASSQGRRSPYQGKMPPIAHFVCCEGLFPVEAHTAHLAMKLLALCHHARACCPLRGPPAPPKSSFVWHISCAVPLLTMVSPKASRTSSRIPDEHDQQASDRMRVKNGTSNKKHPRWQQRW